MLISHRKRFIYTKTAKTAGTSIEVYFEPWCYPPGEWRFSHSRDAYESRTGVVGRRSKTSGVPVKWSSHMGAADIRSLIGEEIWNGYFKFCVVRNPWDRMVSLFHHGEKSDGSAVAPNEAKERFRAWALSAKEPIRKSLGTRRFFLIEGRISVDYFMRYENLLGDLEEVCGRLNIPFQPDKLLKLKNGTRPAAIDFREYYDDETRALVERHSSFEREQFGYRFSNA